MQLDIEVREWASRSRTVELLDALRRVGREAEKVEEVEEVDEHREVHFLELALMVQRRRWRVQAAQATLFEAAHRVIRAGAQSVEHAVRVLRPLLTHRRRRRRVELRGPVVRRRRWRRRRTGGHALLCVLRHVLRRRQRERRGLLLAGSGLLLRAGSWSKG